MARDTSVSFPWGTMVTYETWDVPLQELELCRKCFGNENANVLTNPCLVWNSTVRLRGLRSQEWHQGQSCRTWQRSEGWTIPQTLHISCIDTPDEKALKAAIPQTKLALTPRGEGRSEDSYAVVKTSTIHLLMVCLLAGRPFLQGP